MKAYRRRFCLFTFLALFLGAWTTNRPTADLLIGNPILFVTQVPIPADFTTVASTFGNHRSEMDSVPRGGDLLILYPDGTLRNLTRLAGLGMDGMQGTSAIAVREPSVHWSGTKAVFSMVVGAPTQQFVSGTYRWQIYEITGLGKSEAPVIRKVSNQPPGYNNVSPFYGTDDRILFTSDRPRDGSPHLYPQLDEYEESAIVTGIWSLDPASGDLFLLDHSPSGDFSPSIDSFGRVVFTRWDHLERDQQADADVMQGNTFGTFDYADESATAARLPTREEVFPEPRSSRTDLLAGTNLAGHSFNQFFPWMINEDGTEPETLSNLGRHELLVYFNRSLNDDPNLEEFISALRPRTNQSEISSLLQMKEDPLRGGTYFGIDAPEFGTHAAGQVVSVNAPPSVPADKISVTWVTSRTTANATAEGATPAADHTGLYRNPLPLSNGTLVAAHTAETRAEANQGSRENPKSRYDFRLKTLRRDGTFWRADQPLTSGLTKTVSYFDPDVLVTWSGTLWELDPVEVRARPRPARRTPRLEQQELDAFTAEGVSVGELTQYMKNKGLALIVNRNVTVRDSADRQQPFNLKVSGSSTQTVARPGKVYEVKHLELFQADQLRSLGGMESPRPGRRVLPRLMHDPAVRNPNAASNPAGAVRIAADGSLAAFVPARRAMTWQLIDAAGTGVVRERYWLTFQPGEIRVCKSCHGVNSSDQIGRGAPVNEPAALREILKYWKSELKAPGRRRGARR